MSSIKKNSEFGHPLLQTRIEVEHQDGFVNAARELFNDLIPMATELKTQKREDLDVKSFDDGNKKENNEDVSTARSCRLLSFIVGLKSFEKNLCAWIKMLTQKKSAK
ncbi:hypothetical protein WUBG_10377, partial [Wuchereria bancrofti]